MTTTALSSLAEFSRKATRRDATDRRSGGDGLLSRVRRQGALNAAWLKVRESASVSRSEETRQAAAHFGRQLPRNLDRLRRQLAEQRFRFSPSHGVLLGRGPAKKPRPILVAPIDDRVVQRAILDVLQSLPAVRDLMLVPTSFGGIEGRRVRDALQLVQSSLQSSGLYFIRSDIRSFFSALPKDRVAATLADAVEDAEFMHLVRQAIDVEVGNLAELREGAEHFPIGEIGIAQGCCLSPLLGNLYLNRFDQLMNDRGILCVRYIDDFVVLGSKPSAVKKAYESGRAHLRSLGLDAYDLDADPEKVGHGWAAAGLDFLGCRLVPGLTIPSRVAKKRLLEKIRDQLDAGLDATVSMRRLALNRRGAAHVLARVSETIRGWGNQYSFCNDRRGMQQLDAEIDMLIAPYRRKIGQRMQGSDSAQDRRRLLGVHLLADCKVEILPVASAASVAAAPDEGK